VKRTQQERLAVQSEAADRRDELCTCVQRSFALLMEGRIRRIPECDNLVHARGMRAGIIVEVRPEDRRRLDRIVRDRNSSQKRTLSPTSRVSTSEAKAYVLWRIAPFFRNALFVCVGGRADVVETARMETDRSSGTSRQLWANVPRSGPAQLQARISSKTR
jgi:hypothetical protein